MAEALKLRLYDTNLLLGRELEAGDRLTLQHYPHYPNVDFAVRVLRDQHYKGTVMPSDTVAFGTDLLGYLPPGVAKVLAPKLTALEGKGRKPELGIDFVECKFVEMDRWGAAIVAISGEAAEMSRSHAEPIEDQMGLMVEADMTG